MTWILHFEPIFAFQRRQIKLRVSVLTLRNVVLSLSDSLGGLETTKGQIESVSQTFVPSIINASLLSPSDPFNLFSITSLWFFFLTADVTSVFLPGFLSFFCSLMSSPRLCTTSLSSVSSSACFCLTWSHPLDLSDLISAFCICPSCRYLFPSLFPLSPIFFSLSTFYLSFSPPISPNRLPLPLISGFPSFPSYLLLCIACPPPPPPPPLSSGPTAH